MEKEAKGIPNRESVRRKEREYSTEEEYTSDGSSEYTEDSDYEKYPRRENAREYPPVARQQTPHYRDSTSMVNRRRLSAASSANASRLSSSVSQAGSVKRHVGVQMTTKYILQAPSEPSIPTRSMSTQTDKAPSPVPEEIPYSTPPPPIIPYVETHVVTRELEQATIVEKPPRKSNKKKKERRREREREGKIYRERGRSSSPEVEVEVHVTKEPAMSTRRKRSPSPVVEKRKESVNTNEKVVPTTKEVENKESFTQHIMSDLPPKVYYIPEKPSDDKASSITSTEHHQDSKIEKINKIVTVATDNRYQKDPTEPIIYSGDNTRSNYMVSSMVSDQRSSYHRIQLTPEDMAIIKALAYERAKEEIYGYNGQQNARTKRRPLSAVSEDKKYYYRSNGPDPREIMLENVYLERQRLTHGKFGMSLAPSKKVTRRRPLSASLLQRTTTQLPGIKAEKRHKKRQTKKIQMTYHTGQSHVYNKPFLTSIN